MKGSIIVKTLGKFELSNDFGILNDELLRSDMLKKLLIYLLLHRKASSSVQELTQALWMEEEIENPVRALNNLVYRLRTVLKTYLGDEKYIITGRGSYSWNKEIAVVMDVEQFEELSQNRYEGLSVQDKIKKYETAFYLYEGKFLESCFDVHWIMMLSTYYHSMFLELIKKLCVLYLKNNSYKELEKVCVLSLKNEVVEEDIYYYYITSLIRQKKHEFAISKYEEAVNHLYKIFGVQVFEKLDSVWDELKGNNDFGNQSTLKNIHQEMKEVKEDSGVFFCGYPIFKEIYRLEVRKNLRRGESHYLILFTLGIEKFIVNEEKNMKDYLTDQGMKKLKEVLQSVLRMGDVATRYSRNQYLVLLPTCTYENSVKVSQRVIEHFEHFYKKNVIKLKTEFEQISNSVDKR